MSLREDIFSLSDGDKECVEKPVKSSNSSESPQKLIKSMIKVSSYESFTVENMLSPSFLELSLKKRKQDV